MRQEGKLGSRTGALHYDARAPSLPLWRLLLPLALRQRPNHRPSKRVGCRLPEIHRADLVRGWPRPHARFHRYDQKRGPLRTLRRMDLVQAPVKYLPALRDALKRSAGIGKPINPTGELAGIVLAQRFAIAGDPFGEPRRAERRGIHTEKAFH